MNLFYFLISLLLIADVVAIFLIILSFPLPNSIASRNYKILVILIAAWCTLETSSVLSLSPRTAEFLQQCCIILMELIAIYWVVFFCHISFRFEALRIPFFISLLIFPLITFSIVYNPDFASLLWLKVDYVKLSCFWLIKPTQGIWYWLHLIFCFSLFSLGTFFIIPKNRQGGKNLSKKNICVILGALLPLLFFVLSSFIINPEFSIDIASFGFIIGCLFLYLGLFFKNPVNQFSFADDLISGFNHTGIISLKIDGTIHSFNSFAKEMLNSSPMLATGIRIESVIPNWDILSDQTIPENRNITELCINNNGENRWFNFWFSGQSEILDNAGGIILLSDITKQKLLKKNEQEEKLFSESLQEILKVINSTLDLDQVLDFILDQAERIVPYHSADILLYDPQYNTARIVRNRNSTTLKNTLNIVNRTIELNVKKYYGLKKVLETKQSFIFNDVNNFSEWVKLPQTWWVRSCLITPIINRDEIIGFISLTSAIPSFFTINHIEHLHAYSDHAALAIENARLFNETQNNIKKLENSNRETKKALIKAKMANDTKDVFLSNISHEIRNPLNVIIGLCTLLSNTDLQVVQRNYLKNIQQSSLTLLYILNDILDFSKIKKNKISLDNSLFFLNHVLFDFYQIVPPLIEDKRIDFNISISQNIPMALVGDPLRLKQIIMNLVSNAIKFTTEGEIAIIVNLIKKENDYVWLNFCVHDTGIGILTKNQARIFQAFVQVENSTTRKNNGTGLGLSIVKSLVSLMGGEIKIRSKIGKGSDFCFTIPLRIDKDVYSPTSRFEKRKKNLKILLLIRTSSSDEDIFSFDDYPFLQVHKIIIDLSDDLEKIRGRQLSTYDLIIFESEKPLLVENEIINSLFKNYDLNDPPIINIISPLENNSCINKHSRIRTLINPVNQDVLIDTIFEVTHKKYYTNFKTGKSNSRQQTASLVGKEILVVDDNEINRHILSEILRNDGAKIDIASNGYEAIQKIKNRKVSFDAIIMDIQMPVLDGYDTTHIIRNELHLKTIPIIAVSAYSMNSDRKHCMEIGINEHIAKPIDIDLLLSVINRWVNQNKTTINTPAISADPYEFTKNEIDIENFMIRLKGNQDLILLFLKKFSEEYHDIFQKIKTCIDEDNFIQAQQLIHNLKGIACNLSMTNIYHATCNLEIILRNHNYSCLNSELDNLNFHLKKVYQFLNDKTALDELFIHEEKI